MLKPPKMKTRNIFLLGLSLLLVTSCATSKKIKMADDLYEEGSYYNAVDAYEEVHQKKENNTRITFQTAETNRHLKDYAQAEKWYTKTLELNEKAWPEARFYNALMMKAQGDYDKAIKEFDTFIGSADDAKDSDGVLATLKRRAKLEKEGCELALQMMEEKSYSEVEEVAGINHNLQDFSPKYIDNDQVLMAALLPENAVNLDEAHANDDDYYAKLFFSNQSKGTWTNEMLPENINVEGFHNGNGILTKDGNILYYTQCAEDDAHHMTCNIYKSERSGASWTDPEMLSINKKNASSTHPALAYDADGNEVLYFTSDRSGGKGGMDLWYATIEDGEFSSAKNLGSTVNTKYDEVTPFYDNANNILYFSSNGHPSIGGLDVFKIDGNIDDWAEEVVNAGYPLNSSADDLYLALNETGSNGYIVSNRPGTTSSRGETCCDDVFKVKLKTDKYVLVEATDTKGNKLSDVEISLYKVLGENDFEFINDGTTGGDNLYFLVENFDYKINGEKEGYWPSIENLKADEVTGSESDTIVKVLIMRPINRAVVENVYFAFDMDNIREMYQDEMDSVVVLLNKYEELILKIDGHTDSKGSDSYNQALSERRADAAKAYIMEQGIDEERILTEGYGETKPIAPNENPDGSDNPAGRAKNRRVEFNLLNDVNEDLPIEVEYEAQEPETID